MGFMNVKCAFKFIVPKIYNFHKTVCSFDFVAYELCTVNLCKKIKRSDWYKMSK